MLFAYTAVSETLYETEAALPLLPRASGLSVLMPCGASSSPGSSSRSHLLRPRCWAYLCLRFMLSCLLP
jgi:hypothetical protein